MSWARRRDQTRRRAGTAARWALTRARAWLAPHDDGATRPSAGPDTSDVNRMFEWCQATTGSRYRPQYLWPTLQSASSAKALGVPRISVVEFGVAGGNGLLALEEAAAAAESLLGIGVAVAGFDTGKGLPPPVDHRDVPFVLRPGYFEMDERALRDRLSRAELVLGPVAETLGPWLEAGPAPVGFAAFDLDYWSSTAYFSRGSCVTSTTSWAWRGVTSTASGRRSPTSTPATSCASWDPSTACVISYPRPST